MKEYETRPLSSIIKKGIQAKKNHLKWYEANRDNKYPHDILGQVATMQRLYERNNTLYSV